MKETSKRERRVAGNKDDFSFTFKTPKPAEEVYLMLKNIDQWWIGFYEETIEGESENIGDEFTFLAGGGLHYTRQKLVELQPNKRISWEVIESQLSFVEQPGEWMGTRIGFELQGTESGTQVTFTHQGLSPNMECYANCSNAWTGYFNQLKTKLQ